MDVIIRRARARDVREIQRLIEAYADDRILLTKAPVALYEDVPEFWVAERTSDGRVVGCGAVHVMWEDLAEVRTVAVDPSCRGQKIGHRNQLAVIEDPADETRIAVAPLLAVGDQIDAGPLLRADAQPHCIIGRLLEFLLG